MYIQDIQAIADEHSRQQNTKAPKQVWEKNRQSQTDVYTSHSRVLVFNKVMQSTPVKQMRTTKYCDINKHVSHVLEHKPHLVGGEALLVPHDHGGEGGVHHQTYAAPAVCVSV